LAGDSLIGLAQTNLGQDALAGEQFSAEANYEAEHGQTAIPGFSKFNKTEAGCRLSHVLFRVGAPMKRYVLRVPMAVSPQMFCCSEAGDGRQGPALAELRKAV
jgi:hypothetical protein